MLIPITLRQKSWQREMQCNETKKHDLLSEHSGSGFQPSRLLAADGLHSPFSCHFFFRCLSNQSAKAPVSLAQSGQPCSAPFLTTNSHGTLASFSLSMIVSACWIGTSLSASPCMISVGGESSV